MDVRNISDGKKFGHFQKISSKFFPAKLNCRRFFPSKIFTLDDDGGHQLSVDQVFIYSFISVEVQGIPVKLIKIYTSWLR